MEYGSFRTEEEDMKRRVKKKGSPRSTITAASGLVGERKRRSGRANGLQKCWRKRYDVHIEDQREKRGFFLRNRPFTSLDFTSQRRRAGRKRQVKRGKGIATQRKLQAKAKKGGGPRRG